MKHEKERRKRDGMEQVQKKQTLINKFTEAMKRKEKERRKRVRRCMEQVPEVLVEEILERLGVKSLVRFTCVSKQWNSTIKSTPFASRHLIRAQSRDPDLLLGGKLHTDSEPCSYLRTLKLGSSQVKKIRILPKPERYCSITGSCDGLVCVYDHVNLMYLINPATRWYRSLPKAKVQRINRLRLDLNSNYTSHRLGFGKDTVTGKYKMVWLYNSSELDLVGETTCEVFDFSTNTWRHVTGSTHGVTGARAVYLDGSLHWLTRPYNGETKILYFDLHTEVFQVMAENPIGRASPSQIYICSLNNRLCVSEKKRDHREIWSLNSNKVWEKTYSIMLGNLDSGMNIFLNPVTFLNKSGIGFLYPYANNSSVSDLDQAISFIPSLISI